MKCWTVSNILTEGNTENDISNVYAPYWQNSNLMNTPAVVKQQNSNPNKELLPVGYRNLRIYKTGVVEKVSSEATQTGIILGNSG